MILFFHLLCLLARYIVSNFSKSLSSSKSNSTDEVLKGRVKQPKYENGVLKFCPPVYVQRYETVALILQDTPWKGKIRKVADFGCAELGLFMYLKNMEGLNEILAIDIDKDVLKRCSYKAAPLASDYLYFRAVKPLEVYILAGSIEDFDDRLIGTDAVIAIELIEHLSEEAFKKMPYNVFNLIKPKLAIFTTPNADFNPLFPDLKKFRHPDHKFEWTRKEFYNWTQGIIQNYPEYMVKFYGIGAGPEGTENLGCCSQMAVFQKSDDSEFFSSPREKSGKVENYELIKHYSYPVYVDTRTREQKIVDEILYQVRSIRSLFDYYSCDKDEFEVPLKLLMSFMDRLCPDEEELINILNDNGIKIKYADDSWFIVLTNSDCESPDESLKIDRDSSFDETVEDNETADNFHTEENWDLEDELHSDDIANFQTARSLDHFEEDLTPKGGNRGFTTKLKVLGDCVIKDDIVSGSMSCNPIIKRFDSESPDSSTPRSKDSDGKRYLVKSKIPRKKKFRETEECSPGVKPRRNFFYVRKHFENISKSCSLDSCLEIINSGRLESDKMAYLNLIPGGSGDFRKVSSSSSGKSNFVIINSGSSLLSGSFDKAVDSGYPVSYSPPGFDLTTEQVDDVFTENVLIRSSSSISEDDGDVDYDNQRIVRDVFVEDVVVENGDLANNNRDREGNNVEGEVEQL